MGIKEADEASFKPFGAEELKLVDAQLEKMRAALMSGKIAAAVMVGLEAKPTVDDRHNWIYVAASTRQVMEAVKNLCLAMRCDCTDPLCETNRYSSLINLIAAGYLSEVPLSACIQDITDMVANAKSFAEILRDIATRQSGRGKMN